MTYRLVKNDSGLLLHCVSDVNINVIQNKKQENAGEMIIPSIAL